MLQSAIIAKSNNMKADKETCAREILETVPAVMRFIRTQIRQSGKGVTLPQFRTLTFINRTPDAPLSAAAEHLGLSNPAMSRLVDGLVRSGLVKRSAASTNRRQLALSITPKGREMLECVRGAVRSQLADSMDGLAKEELEAVSHAMTIMRAVFDAAKPVGQ